MVTFYLHRPVQLLWGLRGREAPFLPCAAIQPMTTPPQTRGDLFYSPNSAAPLLFFKEDHLASLSVDTLSFRHEPIIYGPATTARPHLAWHVHLACSLRAPWHPPAQGPGCRGCCRGCCLESKKWERGYPCFQCHCSRSCLPQNQGCTVLMSVLHPSYCDHTRSLELGF